MSYSRWAGSKFYSYWHSANVYDRGDELFSCSTSIDRNYMFTYTECKNMIDNGMAVKGRINEIVGDEDVTELQGYMREFIKDVDREYEGKN